MVLCYKYRSFSALCCSTLLLVNSRACDAYADDTEQEGTLYILQYGARPGPLPYNATLLCSDCSSMDAM